MSNTTRGFLVLFVAALMPFGLTVLHEMYIVPTHVLNLSVAFSLSGVFLTVVIFVAGIMSLTYEEDPPTTLNGGITVTGTNLEGIAEALKKEKRRTNAGI